MCARACASVIGLVYQDGCFHVCVSERRYVRMDVCMFAYGCVRGGVIVYGCGCEGGQDEYSS